MPETTLDITIYAALLDSMKDAVIFVDTEHIIRYMNAVAMRQFQGAALLGRSVFACHVPAANEKILQVLSRLQAGAEEELTADNGKLRIFMRAVRDTQGTVIGYYERYEHAWE
jgi:DUF438 domain-containing protein